MILFCLPYAGGSSVVFHKWKKYLNDSIQIKSIELKGRGKRYNESFFENINEAVDDIFETIKDIILNDDYAIYGHSMGSLLAYELYYKIDQIGIKKPKHIFFSGYSAPNIIIEKNYIHKLPDYDFIKKVLALGGIPDEFTDKPELIQIFMPIIRSDFKLLENYKYEKRENKISCNVSILNGKQDPIIKSEQILEWKNHVCSGFKVYTFDGHHFFINNNVENITNIINDTLIN